MRAPLLWHVLLIEGKRTMSYRVDFWISVVGGMLANIGIPYFIWTHVYSSLEAAEPVVGGLTRNQMLAYYVCGALVMRVVRGSDLPMSLAEDIYEGGLNRYLVYPTPYQPFKYAQQLGALLPCLLQFALFGLAFLLVLEIPEGVEISMGTLGMSAAAMALANLLYFQIGCSLQMVAFWADNVWSLAVLLRMASGLLGGLLLPLSLFPAGVRAAIDWTPFPGLFALPIQSLLGWTEAAAWLGQVSLTCLWCAIFFAINRVIWRRGQHQYTGVGI